MYLIYAELNISTIIQIFEWRILLFMLRYKISQFQPLHLYNTRLKKNTCNLTVPRLHTDIGTQNLTIEGVLLLCKYNINLLNTLKSV